MEQLQKKILVVEDDPVDFKMISVALRKNGVENEIIRGRDGEDGLRVLKESNEEDKFLVLLDLRMPRISGHEFLRLLRGDPATHKTTVLVLTSAYDEKDEKLAKDLGVAGYLVKGSDPVKDSDNVKVVKKYL